MLAILTGDLIQSRKMAATTWMPTLKEALNRFGVEPKEWEIYRGDSFQLQTQAEEALKAALTLKASIKQHKALDVRIGIGLGKKDYDAEKVTEANGSAFVRSGECFDALKKQRLALHSGNSTFDNELNLMLDLASLTMNEWPPVTATIVKTAILNPEMDQNQLAELLGKEQPNISRALKNAGFDEISRLMQHYKNQLKAL